MVTKRGLKILIFICAFMALAFIVFGGLSSGYSSRNILLLGVTGAVFGSIGAPEIEPSAFSYPLLWQIFFSVLGCVLFAYVIEASGIGYTLAILVGLVLGYLAPYWIKGVSP